MKTYIVYGCILKFVLIIIVKDDTVFIQETHNWSLPSRATQEVYDDIEEPIL